MSIKYICEAALDGRCKYKTRQRITGAHPRGPVKTMGYVFDEPCCPHSIPHKCGFGYTDYGMCPDHTFAVRCIPDPRPEVKV
jgi:hypothetical protein